MGFGPVRNRRTQLTLPWEEQAFREMSQTVPDALRQMQDELLALPSPVPLPKVETAPQPGQTLVQTFRPRLRATAAWTTVDARAERQAALAKWSQILRAVPSLFDATSLSEIHNEQEQIELGMLDLFFSRKSTNTLNNRASVLRRFAAWMLKHFPSEPVSESILFLFSKDMASKQSDTGVPDQLVQAINFTKGTIKLHLPAEELISARVSGLAHQCLRRKKPTVQKPPLTADQVRWLETMASSADDLYDRFVASTVLLMIYGRARYSDLKRATAILVDIPADQTKGYIELEVQDPKQARATNRRRMMLPLVAPALGIGESPWAAQWLHNRRRLGLACNGPLFGQPLLPELLADGSLSSGMLSTSALSKWTRALLARQPDADMDKVIKISSHSLKATGLSWAAKSNMPIQDRTLLGLGGKV